MPEELFTKSVTASDFSKVSKNGSILQVMVPFYMGGSFVPLPPALPAYWSLQRDLMLRNTLHHEPMWAAAVSISITKVASLAFELEGDASKRRVDEVRHYFLEADGKQVGWVGFLSKHLRDYLLTDNGAFVEIVRASKSIGSRIIGIRHLDSARCTRTGDPDIPVLYRDKWGRIHQLRDYQVMMFADMPDPTETYNGVGLCAASRSYAAIYKLSAIESYLREKVAGLRPLAIYIVNGVLDKQLRDSINAARTEEVARGIASYMGAVIIGVPDDQPPQLVTIPLAELPDRFDRKQEFDMSVLTYADNLGLDPQDLQPLSGGSLGTGAQSQVLHDKARGKGLVAWRQAWTHAVNLYLMPKNITFTFAERDYGDQEKEIAIQKSRADLATARITAGITTAPQELQLLVDAEDLPPEFLQVDATGQVTMTDTSNPEMMPDEGEVPMVDENGQPVLDVEGQPMMTPVAQPEPQQARVWGTPETGAKVAQEQPVETEPPKKKVWGLKEKDALMEEPAKPSLVPMDRVTQALDPAVIAYAQELARKVLHPDSENTDGEAGE